MISRILVLFCLLFAAPATAASTILVFGDSLSAAYGIPREAGWVSLLQRRLAERHYSHWVVNASVSGETTAGGLRRIEPALAEHKPAIVIVELGANDGLRGLPLDAMADNLRQIILACQRQQAQVLLVGMRLPPNYGTRYTQKFQETYGMLAQRQRVASVPFLLEGIQERALFQADNLHPTAAAQPRVLENVWKGLLPLLKKPAR